MDRTVDGILRRKEERASTLASAQTGSIIHVYNQKQKGYRLEKNVECAMYIWEDHLRSFVQCRLSTSTSGIVEKLHTCKRSLSSPITAAVFQSMISEKGSSQPLLSITGTQAACKTKTRAQIMHTSVQWGDCDTCMYHVCMKWKTEIDN